MIVQIVDRTDRQNDPMRLHGLIENKPWNGLVRYETLKLNPGNQVRSETGYVSKQRRDPKILIRPKIMDQRSKPNKQSPFKQLCKSNLLALVEPIQTTNLLQL